MKLRVFLLTVFSILVLYPQVVNACSCSPPPSKEEQAKILSAPITPDVRKFWLEEFEGAVLTGTVMKIEKADVKWFNEMRRLKKVTIRVERAYVGVTDKTFVIYTHLGNGGDCGVPYSKGKTYFFFAGTVGGLLWTNICSPRDPNSYQAKFFEKMFGRDPNRPVAKAKRIGGWR